ncbi:MAG: energy-coupled thiamine transporter ThiT [Clostridia bacterium]|nr:energy-coupled thiamine transporter ThiT [Clostridia bacterium]
MPAAQWAAVIAVIAIGIGLMALQRKRFTARMLSAGALCVALACLLSYICVYHMPQGGSITPASMLPIMLYAWWYGPAAGVIAGAADGVLQLIQGAYIIHPIQFLLDYILPFAVLGLAGLFRKKEGLLPVGITFAALMRYVCHVLSGVVFFASYAPVGQSPLIYSLVYNGSFMLPETIICLLIALIPPVNKLIRSVARTAARAV